MKTAEVPLILTRHEQATVYIADGYARSTGEVGVAMVTKGPGRCNAFTAIVNAFTDCVPLVVIFGHSSRNQLGQRHAAGSALPRHFSNHGEVDLQRAVGGTNSRSVSPRLYIGAFGQAGAGDHRGAAGYQHGAGGDAALSQDPARALRSRSRRCRKVDRIVAGRQAAADLRRPRRAVVAGDRGFG